MFGFLVRGAVAAGLFLGVAPPAFAADGMAPHFSAELNAPGWQDRARAFYGMLPRLTEQRSQSRSTEFEPDNATVKLLLGLLGVEIRYMRKTKDVLSEGGDDERYGDYIGDLIDITSSIRDIRISKLLLEDEILLTGGMARRGIAASGHAIVADVLVKYDSATAKPSVTSDSVRCSLLMVMTDLSANRSDDLTTTDFAEFDRRFRAASYDKIATLRQGALNGMAVTRSLESLQRLREMVENDPSVQQQGAAMSYPLRGLAAKALAGKTLYVSGNNP